MDHLISQYIDDELTLDDKIEFVRAVQGDASFTEETVSFLAQEKLLRRTLAAKVRETPVVAGADRRPPPRFFPGLVGWSGWAVAVLLLFVLAGTDFRKSAVVELSPPVAATATRLHRFVIFKPGITSAEISGSFTGWRKVPLRPAATDGYWEVTLEIEAGEHRFVYILDNETLFPDPTVPARETDDFGASNSILRVEV
jgi:Glycogen recognition site of AMP-activated protein kinase